jgi:tetratricopeptide (TPR) repeat protein
MLMNQHSVTMYGKHIDKANHNDYTRLKPDEHLRQVKALLHADKKEAAFALLQQSLVYCPDEPVLLSYYGLLLVLVYKRYRMGIETCQKAIEKHNKDRSFFDQEMLYPVFYHNLGKAYAAAGKRKEALEALKIGLAYDSGNNDIKKELLRMGVRRKKPSIPFLDRSNPLNKFIGIVLYKKQSASDTTKRATARRV